MNRQFNLTSYIFLVVILTLLWLKGYWFLDPDFGWHLKMGQFIASSGIPQGDPFSYTMASFPFVDHEWLTNVIFSKLYPATGTIGLAGASAVLVILTLAIAARGGVKLVVKRKSLFLKDLLHKKISAGFLGINIILLLSVSAILPFTGIRPQVQSWFFLSILLWILFKKRAWSGWRYLIPALMLFWTNLHGSFAVGIATLLFVTALRSFRRRMVQLDEVVVLFLSVVATFINPYGIRLWGEVWQQISDSGLRWSISEWMPLPFHANFPMVALITLSFILVTRYRQKFLLEELGLYLVFLLQSIASSRHLPLWVIVSLPMTTRAIGFFYDDIKKDKISVLRFSKVYRAAWIGSLVMLVVQSGLTLRGARLINEKGFYPQKAIEFLQENAPQGEMFSRYGWGGYLIWKYPEKKVFIDGRMPSWRWDKAPENESFSAFDDYNDLLSGEIKYKEVFEKYGVDTVLWPAPQSPGLYDLLQDKLDNLLVRFGKEKSDFDFLQQLSEDGWQEVYKDSVAVIYKKSLQD